MNKICPVCFSSLLDPSTCQICDYQLGWSQDQIESYRAQLRAAINDPDWCSVCDRPGDDCACELDPNGPLPWSACVRLAERNQE